MQTLENKTIIITGGSKGIGRVLALRCAHEKMKIVISARSIKELENTKAEIAEINKNVIAVQADVSLHEDVKKIINEAVSNFNDINYLVNNAAVITHKSMKDFVVNDWKQVIDVNVYGTFLMCKEALPYMEKLAGTTGASIINIASTSGKRGYESGTAYSASKFAITGFSESLFKEVRQHNIRVMVVYPSAVDTSVNEESKLKTIGKGVYMRAEDVADSIIFSMKLPQRALIKEIEIWGTNP
jgi:3-oxoacyl-[acyl-carrier protein] reductase